MPLAEKGVRGKGRQPLSPPQHAVAPEREQRSGIEVTPVSRTARNPEPALAHHFCEKPDARYFGCAANQIFASPSPRVQLGKTSESESKFESAAITMFTSGYRCNTELKPLKPPPWY
jgi:hypothetical protein